MSAYEFWRVEVDNRISARDTFTRVASSSWGSPDLGPDWTNTGGSASDHSVNGSRGVHSVSAVNSSRWATITNQPVNGRVTVYVTTDATPVGGSQFAAVAYRFADTDNTYLARLELTTGAAINLTLRKRVTASESLIGSTINTGLTYVVGALYGVTLELEDTTLRAKVWLVSAGPGQGWMAEETDRSITAAGGAGVRSILSASNTNTLPVTYNYDAFAVDYVGEHWIDVTSDVDTFRAPISSTTGEDAESSGNPAALSLVLNNRGFKYTPGNTQSAYALTTGMPIRVTETVGYTTAQLFTGFIEFPEISTVNVSMEQDQSIAVSAVDDLSRWERSGTFVSTLTEHIRYAGGSALKAFWPLNDSFGATVGRSLITGVGPLVQVVNYDDVPRVDQLLWGDRDGPPGDDALYVQMDPTDAVVAASYVGSPRLARRDFTVTPVAGGVYGIIVWVHLPSANIGTGPGQILVSHANASSPPTIQFSFTSATGWQFDGQTSLSATWTLTGPTGAKTDGWTCVAGFIEVDTNNLWFIVNGTVVTGVAGGATGGTGPLQEVALDGVSEQSFALLQIYSGQFDPVTLFNNQYEVGLTGLERQTTGGRIRTILRYAGKTEQELDQVDDGTAVMQRARLAGLTVADALYEARDTELGDLYMDGAGLPTFADRRRLYNV